jgi:hypothetical protein
MNRSRLNPRDNDKTRTLIVWRQGPFRVECSGAGPAMRLAIYYGRFVMAEETVDSAETAWQRAQDICRQLGGEDIDSAELGSA